MKRIQSNNAGIHARKARMTLLRDEWEGHKDGTTMWSPLYGEVRIEDVDAGEVRFVDNRGKDHAVDGSFKARVADGVTTAEEMLRPDMDPSVLWDYLGAEYIELHLEGGEDEEGYRRSVVRWTEGELAYDADSDGLDDVLGMTFTSDADAYPILVRSARQRGLYYILNPYRGEDHAAYDWVVGHCRKRNRAAEEAPVWRCKVTLSKTFTVLAEAGSRDRAYWRLNELRYRLPDLLERHATGFGCEPDVDVDVIRETERTADPDPDVTPDWDMDLDAALSEEGE